MERLDFHFQLVSTPAAIATNLTLRNVMRVFVAVVPHELALPRCQTQNMLTNNFIFFNVPFRSLDCFLITASLKE